MHAFGPMSTCMHAEAVCMRGSNLHAQVPAARPDGDVELLDAGKHFSVPVCEACGGVLKPHVVFFGGERMHAHAHT